jgi:hypothetical protein
MLVLPPLGTDKKLHSLKLMVLIQRMKLTKTALTPRFGLHGVIMVAKFIMPKAKQTQVSIAVHLVLSGL